MINLNNHKKYSNNMLSAYVPATTLSALWTAFYLNISRLCGASQLPFTSRSLPNALARPAGTLNMQPTTFTLIPCLFIRPFIYLYLAWSDIFMICLPHWKASSTKAELSPNTHCVPNECMLYAIVPVILVAVLSFAVGQMSWCNLPLSFLAACL